jgi:hypothetical protein
MRPKVVIAILLAGLAGFAGIFFLKRLTTPDQPLSPAANVQTLASAPPVSFDAGVIHEVPPAVPTVSAVITNSAPENQIAQVTNIPPVAPAANAPVIDHETYAQSEIDKLQELQANDDAQSLHAILADLTNSDKTIRAAAIEATTQFGSRDAIPVLKDLAARTPDPDEKQQLQDAADFLALPSITELREQNPHVKIQSIAPPPASVSP